MVVKVAVTKESRDDHVGVVLEEKQGSSGDTRIVVSSIGYHSLFANTRLRAGMEILSINDKSVQSASNATKLLQDAHDFVELVAIDPSASMAVGSDPAPIQRRRSTDPDSGGVSYGNQDATLIDSAAPPPIRPSSSHGRGSYKPDPDGETGQSIRESQKRRASHKSSSSHNKAPSSPRKQSNKSSRDPTMISSPPPSSPRKSTNSRRSSRDPTMIQAPVPAPPPPPPPQDDEESFEEETFLTTATPVDYNDQAYVSVPVVAASAVGNPTRSQNQPDGSVKVAATKPSQDAPVGIHLRQSGNEIVIDSISGHSIFQGSALRSGMVLLSINGCECAGMTPDFANILLQTSSADVNIVAKDNSSHRASSSNNNSSNGKIISVTATKASRDSRVGIAMRRKDGVGFCVDSIAPTSIFANTELQQGMKVLTINGVSIQQSMSSQQVLSLLVNAESKVTIVAEKADNNGAAAMRNSSTSNNHHGSNHNSVNNHHGNNVSVTVTKPTPSSRVGISIKRYDGIGFVVESIAPGSLFEPTELKKGMKVLSINGVPIQLSMQSEEVLVLLTSAPTNVTIVAERTNHRSSHNSSHMNTSSSSSPSSPHVTVSAMKPTPNSRVGVAMKRHEAIGFLVESISPGSLFAPTELKAGMKIISINGTTVETQMQSQQVLSLLTTAPSLVTIVAERVNSSNKPPPAMMVSVTAPSDLMEGYQFDAQMNGRNFKVTVPPGGVRAGQQFQVPAPTEADFQRFSKGAVNKPSANGTGAPVGQFRNDMCSCFETCPCPTLMGLCCMGILAGQVLQRLKLGPCGTPGDYENTCVIMTAIFVVFAVLTGILFASTSIGYYIYMVFNVYMIVALTCARKHMRERYNIPGAMCGDSCLDDCCCAYWCGCCTVIQMHRHTHDEKQYPYEISSKTGLAANAPEIV
ncbi:expressed unknown protein [Seminavis robusta]|uniref:PDZ domain-containing protein n=1 Tax=Seminavis robusta TaxID=568900 RepID=A0A9N8DQN5_9STRA|nr:expressed unknown protein [Seminavis robusta]|eukprot:Sro302_g112220.1 n/a (918) ;mRNA; f:49284-52118